MISTHSILDHLYLFDMTIWLILMHFIISHDFSIYIFLFPSIECHSLLDSTTYSFPNNTLFIRDEMNQWTLILWMTDRWTWLTLLLEYLMVIINERLFFHPKELLIVLSEWFNYTEEYTSAKWIDCGESNRSSTAFPPWFLEEL